jgi:hypothetical protein
MDKKQIIDAIQDMLGKYAHEARKALIRIGEATIEGERDNASIVAYHEAQAKVYVLGELLEKIANAPDDTQGIITARDDVSGELLAQEILSWTKRTYGEVIDECGERITSRYTALADDIERLCEKYLKKGV